MLTVRVIGVPPFTGVMVTLKLVAGIMFIVLSYVQLNVTVSADSSKVTVTAPDTETGRPKKRSMLTDKSVDA